MADLEMGFLLPLPGWPRAVVESDFGYQNARLQFEGRTILRADSRAALEGGVRDRLPADGRLIAMRLGHTERGAPDMQVLLDGQPARREDELRARPSRSAWIHASLALAASAAGFVASYLYLLRAAQDQSDWALKMGNHMAGWHLLLTFTLFPASVWGQRWGIRLVQIISCLFFFIHLGIAVANLMPGEEGGHEGAIAVFNAVSGAFFFASTLYGNRAYRDMDPVAALRAGRAR
jgi:hypothetical protein